MHPFEVYLKRHNLEALTVALVAKVRYLSVWNAMKGTPITPKHALHIRQAVWSLTGTPYTGPLPLLHEPSVEDLPTIPIKKLPTLR